MVKILDEIVEELKSLPEEKLARAADYIHRLKGITAAEKRAALKRTAGCMSEEEAQVMEDAMRECRRVEPNE